MSTTIYHDASDPQNVGWAYRIDGGVSGALDGDAAGACDAIAAGTEALTGDMAALATELADAGADLDLVEIVPCEGHSPVALGELL